MHTALTCSSYRHPTLTGSSESQQDTLHWHLCLVKGHPIHLGSQTRVTLLHVTGPYYTLFCLLLLCSPLPCFPCAVTHHLVKSHWPPPIPGPSGLHCCQLQIPSLPAASRWPICYWLTKIGFYLCIILTCQVCVFCFCFPPFPCFPIWQDLWSDKCARRSIPTLPEILIN